MRLFPIRNPQLSVCRLFFHALTLSPNGSLYFLRAVVVSPIPLCRFREGAAFLYRPMLLTWWLHTPTALYVPGQPRRVLCLFSLSRLPCGVYFATSQNRTTWLYGRYMVENWPLFLWLLVPSRLMAQRDGRFPAENKTWFRCALSFAGLED